MNQKPTDDHDKKDAKDASDNRDPSDGKSLNKEKNPKQDKAKEDVQVEKDQKEKKEKQDAEDAKDEKLHKDENNQSKKKYESVVRDDQGGNGRQPDKTGLARDHAAHAKLPPPPAPQKDDKNPNASDEIRNKNIAPATVTEEPDHPRNRIYKPHPPYNLAPFIDDKDGYASPPYATTKEGFNSDAAKYVNCHLCVNEEQHKKHKPNEIYLDENDEQHKADFGDDCAVHAK